MRRNALRPTALVNYPNQRIPQLSSIVANSIANAIEGEFGNHHATTRARGSQFFINLLMALQWFVRLPDMVNRLMFVAEVEQSLTMREVANGFKRFQESATRRPNLSISL